MKNSVKKNVNKAIYYRIQKYLFTTLKNDVESLATILPCDDENFNTGLVQMVCQMVNHCMEGFPTTATFNSEVLPDGFIAVPAVYVDRVNDDGKGVLFELRDYYAEGHKEGDDWYITFDEETFEPSYNYVPHEEDRPDEHYLYIGDIFAKYRV